MEIDKIASLRLEPEDIIVLKMQGRCNESLYHILKEQFKNLIPDHKVVVLENDASLSIVRPALKWIKGVPTKDGWYWCRFDKDDLEPLIAKVSAECQIAYECGCECGMYDLAAYEWYGPIEPPEYP